MIDTCRLPCCSQSPSSPPCSPRMIRAKSDALDSALPRGGTLQETPLPSKGFPHVCLEPVLVKFKLISNEMIEVGTFNLKGRVLFLLGGA
eukprot:COSAG01_NODE_40329_length_465_cov_0.743169_2_plen_89_part_01